jgi:lipopolysaccharide export system permease protein
LRVSLRHVASQDFDRRNPEDVTRAPLTATMDRYSDVLPLDNLFLRQSPRQKLQWMTFDELLTAWRRARADEKAAAEPDRTEAGRRRLKLQIAIHEKFATAFSVLSFALIAIPLGLKVSRKETSANLGIALTLAMAYYFLTIMVSWLDRHPGLRPDLLIWVPNLVFQAFGCWMIWRVDRSRGG